MDHTGTYSIKSACQVVGYTRQAYYRSRITDKAITAEVISDIEAYANKERKGCPTRGCRAMYEHFGHQLPIGRDKTIKVLQDNGFRVRYPKRYGRSTQSGTRPFDNLLVNKEVDHVNQVWQADMAHYLYGDRKYYTMYITDVYSQEIIGYGAFSSAHAVNFAEVLRRAVAKAKSYTGTLAGMIHHSDGGKQYESEVYRKLCKLHGIKQSMCMYSYENPYAEKTNDLINNGYLNVWKPKKLRDLKAYQAKAVKDHNQKSKKKSLDKLSPQAFRQKLLDGNQNEVKYILELKPKQPEQVRLKQMN